MSQQDPSYRAEYEAYSARRAAEGLPKVSYRNYLRQWRRSDEGHTARGEPPIEKGGKGGKGGVTPPPPPAKRRQELAEGGDAPPAVKAKGGETPLETAGAPSAQQQAQESHKVLEEAGHPEFPDYVPSCGGSVADINQGRLTVAATKKLIEGLSPCTEPNADIANALMSSFLRTRKRRGRTFSPSSAAQWPSLATGSSLNTVLRIAWMQQPSINMLGLMLGSMEPILSVSTQSSRQAVFSQAILGFQAPVPLQTGMESTSISRLIGTWQKTAAP